MKGEIIDYSSESGEGAISGDDGKRYYFTKAEWKSSAFPMAEVRVDFDFEGKTAIAVYVDRKSRNTSSETDNQTSAKAAKQEIDKRYSSLYCSADERIVLGLCGGLAHKFGVPTAAMRFLVFISFFFVIGWLYLVGIFLPKLPTREITLPQ